MTVTEVGVGNLLSADLNHLLNLAEPSFRALRGSRILVTGGSGFVGKWLVGNMLHANRTLNLDITFVVISRDKTRVLNELRLNNEGQLAVWEIDLSKEFNPISPFGSSFSHMIHLATPTTRASGNRELMNVRKATIGGLELMVALAERSSSKPTLLHTSSGAVYGQNARSNEFIAEGEVKRDQGKITEYGAIKLEAEEFVIKSTLEGKITGTNPRLFAFFGPHLSFEDYAIGNFFRDATDTGVIHVKGHPQTQRSYLYPTDLVHILLQLLVNPIQSPFNVGSKQQITMVNLATEIASHIKAKKITYGFEEEIPNYYVPMINTIENNFNFAPSVSLSQGIQKWVSWREIQASRNSVL